MKISKIKSSFLARQIRKKERTFSIINIFDLSVFRWKEVEKSYPINSAFNNCLLHYICCKQSEWKWMICESIGILFICLNHYRYAATRKLPTWYSQNERLQQSHQSHHQIFNRVIFRSQKMESKTKSLINKTWICSCSVDVFKSK